MAVIYPAPGDLKNTAQLLLLLAGDVPEIVRTVSAGNAFEVPDELADEYHRRIAADDKPTPKRRARSSRKTTEE